MLAAHGCEELCFRSSQQAFISDCLKQSHPGRQSQERCAAAASLPGTPWQWGHKGQASLPDLLPAASSTLCCGTSSTKHRRCLQTSFLADGNTLLLRLSHQLLTGWQGRTSRVTSEIASGAESISHVNLRMASRCLHLHILPRICKPLCLSPCHSDVSPGLFPFLFSLCFYPSVCLQVFLYFHFLLPPSTSPSSPVFLSH